MQAFGFDDSESRDEVLTKTILDTMNMTIILANNIQMNIMTILNLDTDSMLSFVNDSLNVIDENRQYLASVVGVKTEDYDSYVASLREMYDMIIQIRNFKQQLFTTFSYLDWVQAFNG